MRLAARLSFKRVLGRAAALAALDADVLHTLIYRSWSIVAGGATVLLVSTRLNSLEQGYYYTFASLLGLQIFFELGMSQVILQLVSHDVAHRDDAASSRLAGWIGLLRRWYAVAAIGFALTVSAGGAWFLARQPALDSSRWLGPWLCVTIATSANLYLSAMLAVIEGSGSVATVARLRFRQSALGYFAMWLALLAGAGLWAALAAPAVAAMYSARWLRAELPGLRQLPAGMPQARAIAPSWKRDVFPLQWRIAVSWIAGYFIFQLLTPLAFARQGAAEAGRLGITLAVFNATLTAGMSWVNAKFPAMSIHLARKERLQANRLFLAVASRAIAVTVAFSLLILFALAGLNELAPRAAHRFASVPVACCIAIVTVANTFVFAAAAYLRAHKEEPMLWVSLFSGLGILLAVGAGSSLGVLPMMALYAGVTLLVPLPWTFALFRSYFRRST